MNKHTTTKYMLRSICYIDDWVCIIIAYKPKNFKLANMLMIDLHTHTHTHEHSGSYDLHSPSEEYYGGGHGS
jgi:hypothetical protein